jgi:Flp pilus assembly protein TadG
MRANSPGVAALEFALIAPVLFMFIFGIIELAGMAYVKNALDYAVAQAARCASIDTTNCGSASAVQTYASGLSNGSFAASVFTASTAACGSVVKASYPMQLNVLAWSLSVTVSAQSCYPI